MVVGVTGSREGFEDEVPYLPTVSVSDFLIHPVWLGTRGRADKSRRLEPP